MNLKSLGHTVLFILFTTLLLARANATTLQDGLVAHYPFDGNAQDASGMGHHGTVQGGVTYVAGKIGQAARFNGSNGVVMATLPKVKNTYSVSMFSQFNSHRGENQLFYLTRKNHKDRLGYLSTYPPGKKTWHFGSRRYGKGWEDRGTTVVDPQGLSVNQWYHLVFVLNDEEISLFVNGNLLKTIKSKHHANVEAHKPLQLLIGGTTEKYQWMAGLIDEVRVYNRVLSAAEIKTLAKGEITTKPTPTQPATKFSCQDGKRYCKDMTSCEEAYYHLQECGQKRLDRDKNGIPCEKLCSTNTGGSNTKPTDDAACQKAKQAVEAQLAAEKKAKEEALAKLAAAVKAQQAAEAKLAAEKQAKEEALAKLAACEKPEGSPLKFKAVTGDGQCPAGYTLVTPQEARANQKAACQALGTWYIARLAQGGSMDGSGYKCQIRDNDKRGLGHSLCKVGKTEPPKPPKGTSLDLTGTWIGEGYRCGFKRSTEEVKIEQQGNSIVATKITGDDCVPAGSRTFVGTLDTINATWTTGYPNRPACCKANGRITIKDRNTLVDKRFRITFTKKSSSPTAGLNLSGQWQGDGYKCQSGAKRIQDVTIEQNGTSIVATKLTGDDCVRAGSQTFAGRLDVMNITWTTGFPNRPACCQKKGRLTIIDNNTMKADGVTFKRVPPK